MRSALVTAGLLIGLALLAPRAHAQTGGVHGRVIDEEGRPVVGSVVIVESERVSRKSELKTNKKGEYRMIGLQPGPHRVTATMEGYQGRYVEIDVHLGEPTEVMDIQIVSKEAIARVTGPTEGDLREKFGRAVALLRAGQLDEAEGLFRELVEVQPDVAEFHQNLAYTYAQKKDWPHAAESYHAALALKPGDSALVASLAGVLEDGGEPDKAREVLDEALAANPDQPKLQYERGILLIKAQKVPEATEALEKALGGDPTLTDAHYFLGTLLVNQGKVPEAIEHFEAYLASNPENPQNVETAKGLLQALKK